MEKTYRAEDNGSDSDLKKKMIEQIVSPLLAEEMIDAILLPRRSSGGGITFSLFQEDDLQGALFVSPVQPVNAASLVSDLTFKEPGDRVAALLRPCEVRALIELEKLQQVDLDHLFIISIDCLGTCEPELFREMAAEEDDLLERYDKALREGDMGEFPLRDACRFCQIGRASRYDINISLIGSAEDELLLTAGSEAGRDFLEELDLKESALPGESQELLDSIAAEREEMWEEELAEFGSRIEDIPGLIEVLDLCRTCHNCRSACPVCYCRECVFETLTFEHEGRKYIEWAERKGSIKMPSDTLLFHITRLNHMGLSCIACGQCESACPVDIPLLKIFKHIGERAQDYFSYLPGRDVEEPMPLTTYEEDEDFDLS